MKKLKLTISIFSMIVMVSCSSVQQSNEDKTRRILGIFDEMQTTMAAKLQASIKEGGPAAAIETCSKVSPEL